MKLTKIIFRNLTISVMSERGRVYVIGNEVNAQLPWSY